MDDLPPMPTPSAALASMTTEEIRAMCAQLDELGLRVDRLEHALFHLQGEAATPDTAARIATLRVELDKAIAERADHARQMAKLGGWLP